MKGLELSKKFYLTHGKAAIEKEIPELVPRMAIGLAGEGSECFGFDDGLSTDHDFEPGFCIWLTREDYEKHGFQLARIYEKLPKEFEGFRRLALSPVGGSRHGVMSIDDFLLRFLGSPHLPTSLEQWLNIPHESLAAACNGEIFYDGLGEFSRIRSTLLCGYPSDVKLKKIAAHTIMLLQSGQYNYNRCIKRGENGAAQLGIFEFVRHAISLIYLLNDEYEPFYKWAYRKMRTLKKLNELESSLVSLSELGNSELEAAAKSESIDEICKLFISELKSEGLTDLDGDDLEKHAFSIQSKIKSPVLRNMHIMEGI